MVYRPSRRHHSFCSHIHPLASDCIFRVSALNWGLGRYFHAPMDHLYLSVFPLIPPFPGSFLLPSPTKKPNKILAMTHSPQIIALDTVRAYHSGPRIIVEVDIVMAPGETLRGTHDVAEELQVKLESLPDVERAYVHIDYETSHKPEHGLKKIL